MQLKHKRLYLLPGCAHRKQNAAGLARKVPISQDPVDGVSSALNNRAKPAPARTRATSTYRIIFGLFASPSFVARPSGTMRGNFNGFAAIKIQGKKPKRYQTIPKRRKIVKIHLHSQKSKLSLPRKQRLFSLSWQSTHSIQNTLQA